MTQRRQRGVDRVVYGRHVVVTVVDRIADRRQPEQVGDWRHPEHDAGRGRWHRGAVRGDERHGDRLVEPEHDQDADPQRYAFRKRHAERRVRCRQRKQREHQREHERRINQPEDRCGRSRPDL